MYIRPFKQQADTANIAVTAASQALTIPGAGQGTKTLRVANVGTQTVFIELRSGVAALATSVPLLSNTVETFLIQNEVTQIAAIASATGSTLYITVGESS